MPQGSFAAQVSAFAAKSKDRIVRVRNESAERVVDIMQTIDDEGGRLKFDTGFLRASLRACFGEPGFAVTYNPNDGTTFSYDPTEVSMVIASQDLSDVLTFVYTANYALPREYGARGQSPDAFVQGAAMQWQRVVSEVAAELKDKVS